MSRLKLRGDDFSYSTVNLYVTLFKLGMQLLINLHIPIICLGQSSMNRATSYIDDVCIKMVCNKFITLYFHIIHIWYFHIRKNAVNIRGN